MNYQKIYENLMQQAKTANRKKLNKNNPNYVYYENHHIIPKCLNGTNEKNNLVLLTAREHYVSHKLLTRIYPKNIKLLYTFCMLSKIKKKKIIYKVSSKDYEYSKKLRAIILASDEYKQQKNDRWFKKHYAPDKIDNYINSIKGSHYSPSEDHIVHISFKHKDESFILNKKHLQKKVAYYNEQKCYVPFKFEDI